MCFRESTFSAILSSDDSYSTTIGSGEKSRDVYIICKLVLDMYHYSLLFNVCTYVGMLLTFWAFSIWAFINGYVFLTAKQELEEIYPLNSVLSYPASWTAVAFFNFSVNQAERQCEPSICIWSSCWRGLLQQLMGSSEFQELFLVH